MVILLSVDIWLFVGDGWSGGRFDEDIDEAGENSESMKAYDCWSAVSQRSRNG